MNRWWRILAVLIVAFAAVSAQADTFYFTYSGSSFGNNATGSGSITFASGQPPTLGSNGGPLSPAITALTLTITGASSGNGTFTMSNFGSWTWNTNGGTLDFNQELIGQSTNGGAWGTCDAGACGDFNLFANSASAPTGVWWFTLATNNGQGDRLLLTSMTQNPVPEPGTMILLGSGLIAAGGSLRKRFNR